MARRSCHNEQILFCTPSTREEEGQSLINIANDISIEYKDRWMILQLKFHSFLRARENDKNFFHSTFVFVFINMAMLGKVVLLIVEKKK